MSLSGIYRITVRRPGRSPTYYFGQSAKLSERWQQHLRGLRAGRHDNVRMQRSFSKYGEAAFSFSVVLICAPTKESLTLYEQAILDFYRAEMGDRQILNVMKQCVNTHLGVKRRPETVIRMSLSQKGRKKTPEQVEKTAAALRGKKRSDKSRAEQSARMKGKLPHPNSIAAFEAARHTTRISSLRIALCGKPKIHSEETKKKIAKTLTGRIQSKELIDKRIAPLRGRKQTTEEIGNRVASRLANAKAKSGLYGND